MPALSSIGRIKVDIEVDNVKDESMSIVPDDAQSIDLIIGRTWLDLPHIAYTKIGKRVHIGYWEEPSNGRPYATIAPVSPLKARRSWNEDDDDSSENSDDEPELPKRPVRKPLRYGAFMTDR
ncbi:hypothetical protein AVEN_220441-1 [Araneus ventricosus]|uniref:Uncharacterized protein n=1 Tax=Araneus ventricosus TaxID=182803 RepID=A0A4Y2IPU3_ARAVE|nr:hypothetical protein AVEN_220441-1 [Araneus ventricosus]